MAVPGPNTDSSHQMVSYSLNKNIHSLSLVTVTRIRGAYFPSSSFGCLPCVMGLHRARTSTRGIPAGKTLLSETLCFSACTHKGTNGLIAYPLMLIHSALVKGLKEGKEMGKIFLTQPSITQ